MKNFLTVLLTFTLYFNLFTTAHAASVGGWTLGSGVAQGASVVYEGTKRVVIDGVDYIKKGTAKIRPPVNTISKIFARGAAGYALSVAVEQLLGSVDWVLDPANNQILYSEIILIQKIKVAGKTFEDMTIEQACIAAGTPENKTYKGHDANYCHYGYTNSNNQTVITASWGYAEIKEQEETEKKPYPLDLISEHVLNRAANGDAVAQSAVVVAADQVVNEAENDEVKARPIVQQLESSSQTKPADEAAAEKAAEAAGQAKPNTQNPEATDISLTFPIFCNWAPTICEAAQTVISFPQTLTNWWETGKTKAEEWATSISEAWTSVKDWAKSEKQDDTELDIPEQEQPDIDTDIAFGGSCPSDREAEVNMGVGIIKLPISYEPICTTVSTAKPVLIFVGFFIAALIIGGVKTE